MHFDWNIELKSHIDSENPLVSICCITYNHASYIEQAVNAFINQITNFDYEIIIHVDASIDGTSDILTSYQSSFSSGLNIIIEQENQFSKGKSWSLIHDCVISKARGKYIAFCEGDDYWTNENKLQTQIDFLEGHPNVVSTCHAAKVVDGQSEIMIGSMGMGGTSRYLTASDVINDWGIPTASRLLCR